MSEDSRFSAARTVDELMGQLVGACSAERLWDAMPDLHPLGAGIFREDVARQLVSEAIERYRQLVGTCPAVLNLEGGNHRCETPWPHPGRAHSNRAAQAVWLGADEASSDE